ncbi:nesprin-3 isoform X2 [Ascaphus truei]|uniref:nesprin-3 isoform X2 n=1 Tax=Ascaphus truei TaxID=8439 RepID=UPI003F59E5D0
MAELSQDEFETCVETAEAWIRAIHERLKINDNTQGPRSALECRLRETEKIFSLEPEGKLLMDMVLAKAESLLSESSDEEKHEIHSKLKNMKAKFEETTTYMTHCHSRIEWVWLHWSEYLKARDDFTLWAHNMKLTLEPDVELQLGLREKRWQHEQVQVLLSDVRNQARLMDRLLEEAASLYNRIGDPSVDEEVQNEMLAEYKQIKKKAQERAALLGEIMKEHEAYEEDVNEFRSWLNGVIEKLKGCVGGAECTEHRLSILQEINKDIQSGEKQLEVLEDKSATVLVNTSPLGAEKICKELEELHRALAELKLMNNEEEEGLLKTHNSESAFLMLARQLEANINEFRKAIQRLEGSLESGERVKSEDELIALWRTLHATKSALAGEEAKAERVKIQLKDLFKFSKDVQPLSDSVIAAMREYQRAKSKAFKLSTETESALRQHFQNPGREFQHWKPIAERVLDATATHTGDVALSKDFRAQIETLLGESCSIRDGLAMLQHKKNHITGVYGEEAAAALLKEAAASAREREALHGGLLQRKNTLQSLASRSKDFDAAFEQLQQKVSALSIKAASENNPQPDLVGKETQLQRLQMLQEDVVKLETHFEELNSMGQSNPTNVHKVGPLSSEYRTLKRALEINIRKNKQHINDHWVFNNKLLDLQRWIMVTRQELESYQGSSGAWKVASSERDIERLLAEVSEKEIHLHQVQAQGQVVIENSSPEGAAHIQAELRQLNASWASLKLLSDTLPGILKQKDLQRTDVHSKMSPAAEKINQTPGSSTPQENDLYGITGQAENNPAAMKINTGRTVQPGKSPTGMPITTGLRTQKTSQKTSQVQSWNSPSAGKRNRKSGTISELMDVVDLSSMQSKGTGDDHMKLLKEFEHWLQVENSKLNKIRMAEASSSEDMKSKASKLQKLQSRIRQGQRRFESLLVCRPAMGIGEELTLEDLRYRWMLYKSKLKDSGSSSSLKTSEEPRGIAKKSSAGLCPFLQRVCCAALPLQLLLLLLLLLAFLLPLMQETQNCTLSNNFARSFNLMLRYDSPPPT